MKNRYMTIKKLSVFAAAVVFASSVFALELGAAKSQGLVGETASGYLEMVKASSEAAALINDINSKRRSYYQSVAAKNGISLSDVEALAGKKAINKTSSGQYIKVAGKWQQK